MKKYILPKMEIELFDGQDIFMIGSGVEQSQCANGDAIGDGCTSDGCGAIDLPECEGEGCPNDLGF